MLFQEIELDDRITIDSHSCDTTDTTNAEASLSYDSDKVKVNYKNKKKNIIIKQKNHFLLLCESCFWCASSIFFNTMNWICPVCNNNCKVESIPIRNS